MNVNELVEQITPEEFARRIALVVLHTKSSSQWRLIAQCFDDLDEDNFADWYFDWPSVVALCEKMAGPGKKIDDIADLKTELRYRSQFGATP